MGTYVSPYIPEATVYKVVLEVFDREYPFDRAAMYARRLAMNLEEMGFVVEADNKGFVEALVEDRDGYQKLMKAVEMFPITKYWVVKELGNTLPYGR